MNHLFFSFRRVQFAIAILVASLFCVANLYGQTTIVSEGFENSITVFAKSGTSSYKTGTSGSGGTGFYPFNTNYFSAGSYGLQVNNAVVTLTSSSNINTSAYGCIAASLDIASFSGTSTNGADAADSISVFVSTNGGTSYGRVLKLTGSSANNAYWGFSATGTATTSFGTYLSTAAASSIGSVTTAVSRITITNLPASTTLRFKIIIGNDGTNEYWVVDNFKVIGYTLPSTQVSGMSNSSINESGASLSWTNGNGNASLVTIRPTANSILDPSCGTVYTPNTSYASAGQLDVNNRAVFASTTGTSVSTIGLSAQTQYTATGYSYNTGGYYNTTTPASTTFYTLSNPATVTASNLAGTGISSSQIDLTWAAATYPGSGATSKGYILIRRQDGTNPTSTGITNGIAPASLSLASGTTLVTTITSGSTVSYSNTGLTANTSYNYMLVPYTWDGTNAATYNYLTASAPTVAVSTTNGQVIINSAVVSNITTSSATVGATVVGNGGNAITDYGVYYSTSTGVTTSSTKLSLGTANYSGAFTGTLSSLNAATQYFFKGYATNSVGTVLTTEQSFYTLSNLPSAYPASFTATANSASQIDLAFSRLTTISNCAGYLIVQSSSSTLSANPVNGTAYTVGNAIGNGTVVFINTSNGTSSASITGLSAFTTYYYYLFPYNWNASNTLTYNYKTGSNPSANATTLAPPAPTLTSLSASSGYYGSTLSVTGTNLNNVTSITIGGVSMSSYTLVSSTQIDISINNASVNGAVVLNYIGGSLTGSNYTANGYITNAALSYTTASCWLGGVVPPVAAVVNIAHAITVPSIALASAPSAIRILNGGAMTTTGSSTGYQTAAMTIDAGGTFTLGANSVWNINAGGLTNNGTVNIGSTFGGTIKIVGGSFTNNGTFNQGTGKLDFSGASTLTTTNAVLYNLDVNGALTIPSGVVVNNVLNMNSGASIVGNTLTYGTGASVSYNASMSPGLEWPINVTSGTTIPKSVTIASGTTLTLNGTGTHQLNGNLVLNGTLVLSGSNDLAVSGDITGAGSLTAGTRKITFNGTTQNLSVALIFYDMDVLCSNLYVGAGTTVTNKLSVTASDTITTKLGFTLSIQSSALNPTVINGTFINQGTISVLNTGGLTVASGATFIHNATSAISTNLSRTIMSAGSTFVYRGNSALIPSMSVSNRTYQNLRFESTSGSWVDNIGFTGANNCTINGDLFIGSGVTLLNSTYTGTWNIAGNVQVNGTMPTNRINTNLTGTNDTISGSGTIRFGTLTLSGVYQSLSPLNITTLSIPANGSLSIQSSITSGATTVNGTMLCNGSIVSGTTFTLGATGTLGIGHLQGIESTGNQGNIQTSGTRTFPTTASYIYNGTSSQVSGAGLPASVANLTVNNTGTGANNMVTLAQTTTVTNTLNLVDGHFAATGAVELVVSNTATNAITGYASMALANNSSYVEGNLRRKITTGAYDYPLGTSQNYQLATITVNSNTNVNNILIHFDKFASGCGYNGNTPSFYAKPTNGSQSTLVDDMLNFGYYTVEPYDATNTLVSTPNISYDAHMLFNGHTNGVSGYATVNSNYTLMKKPACGGAWGLYGGNFSTAVNQAQNSNSGAVALKLQGLVSFSQFGAGFSSGTVLPLEMTNFTGEQVKEGNQLSWTTLSEEATIKFVIERSENADDFTAIGEVGAKGARNTGAEYNFVDAKAGTGLHYYRLKAVDVDGNVSYSEMIALGTKGAISNFNVYPNPAANEIHFAYQLLQANTQATLKVYSMTGALMHAEVLTKNNQEYLLDTRDYQNGLYFYEILSGGQKLFSGKFDISK